MGRGARPAALRPRRRRADARAACRSSSASSPAAGRDGSSSTRTTTSSRTGDLAAWDSDPFGADLRDGAVVARGTCDDKADITARLQALDYWLDANGGRRPRHDPLGLRGRRGGRQPRAPRGARPACRLALGVRRASGRASCGATTGGPRSAFGCRGVLGVELSRPAARARPARRVRARAPLLRLDADRGRLRASSTRTARWRSRASHDAVRRARRRGSRGRAGGSSPPGAALGPGGVSGWPRRPIGRGARAAPLVHADRERLGDRRRRPVSSETTVVPAVATARVDLHLVPDQEPDDIVRAASRRTSTTHGFAEIEIASGRCSGPRWASLGHAARRCDARGRRSGVYGEPVVYPQLPGAGPARVMLDVLGATTVSPAGTTRLGSGLHAPNEHGAGRGLPRPRALQPPAARGAVAGRTR